MTSFTRLAACLAATLIGFVPVAAVADGPSSHANANACFAMAKGAYGFNCVGSAFTGAALEPISFGGVVEGSATGFYEGYGTFNSSNGSAHTHFSGQVNYGKNCAGHADCEAATTKNCWGHIDYTTNEILVPGGVIRLDPVSVDAAVVDGGREILGTPVPIPSIPGATGDFVPRFACRLVKIRDQD
jgi:hypothetical protein